MKLKLDDAGHVVLKDGLPVYVNAEGKEIAFDAGGTIATISRLNGEAKSHRERAEAAEDKLKGYDGIKDPAAALKALDIVGKLDAKKLIDVGEVDRVRAEAIKAVDEKYAPVVKERDSLQSALVAEKVGGSFARSKLIAERLAIPADMVQARFGDSFKLEGDAVVAYDKGGNKLYSSSRPGDVANFDEALEILIDQYPYKDKILKGAGASGSGASGSGGAAGKRAITRAVFDSMAPPEQAAAAKAMSAGTVVITD